MTGGIDSCKKKTLKFSFNFLNSIKNENVNITIFSTKMGGCLKRTSQTHQLCSLYQNSAIAHPHMF